MYLRQSTTQTIRFGPFLDSTDGITAETALTIAQADMQLSLDGAAFAQNGLELLGQLVADDKFLRILLQFG